MAAGSASRTIRASGRLIAEPTDLSNDFPHGGTEVGRTRLVVMQSLGEMYRIEGEGIGQATDILEADKRYSFACILRGHDDDAIDLLLNDGDTIGDTSHHRVWSAPGTQTPGQSALGRAVILLYVPDDLIHVDALLIYSAIPHLAPGVDITFARNTEFGLPLACECMEDANGNILSIGRFADLSLT
jgi:hypothetical protein